MWKFQSLQQSKTNLSKILDINSVADLNNDAVSDLILIVSDTGVRFFIVLSGKNGKLLWQFPLNPSCISIDRPATVDNVISNSCIKEFSLPGTIRITQFINLLVHLNHFTSFDPFILCRNEHY